MQSAIFSGTDRRQRLSPDWVGRRATYSGLYAALALPKDTCLASSPHVQHLCMTEKGSPTPWSYFLIRYARDTSET